MNAESGTNRWWEYYLPRYLMPSVAGIAIVNWLCSYASDGLRSLLSLPKIGGSLDSSSFILLFLYGNLFCYVASYPVLVFHATRVMDFAQGKWPGQPLLDGYLATSLALFSVPFLHLIHPDCRYIMALVVAGGFSIIQLSRLRAVLSPRLSVKGHGDTVSPGYYYSYVLAHRRGIPVVEETTRSCADEQDPPSEKGEEDEEKEEVSTTVNRTNLWRKEFMDTYRHVREHGNSAFIFLLEIVLAALCYCVLTGPGQEPNRKLAEIGILFGIWALPSAFVHLLAQHLERRFSRYEQKLNLNVRP